MNGCQRQTDVIMIMNFANTFDKVPHRKLLYNLDFYGINDLPENIRSSVRLFANDFVLCKNIKSPILQANEI